MSGLPSKLQKMVDELKEIDDLTEKYETLIEMGREVPDIPSEMKKPECMVHGCQSLVHIYSDLDSEGKIQFHGYADALIVNGLLALLVLGLSGLTPKEFLATSPEFIKETGVVKSLTPSRVNGFYNIYEKMKVEALKYLGKEEKVATEHDIFEAIKPIEDPELHMSVVDLGLIYGVKFENDNKKVVVDMTLTSIACPVGPQLRAAVHAAVAKQPGVEDVYVNLVFNPPWNPRTMASEDALLQLGIS